MNDFIKAVIQRLESEGRYGTAHVYQSVFNAITRYWRQRQIGTIKIDRVFTPTILHDFEKYLLENMLSISTVSTYTKTLRAIYKLAIKEKKLKCKQRILNTKYTSTHAGTKKIQPANNEKNTLITQQISPTLEETQAWLKLLFLLKGITFIDLAMLKKCDLQGNILTYKKQETGEEVILKVLPEAMFLIGQLANRNTKSPFLLSILPENHNVQSDYKSELKKCTNIIKMYRLNSIKDQ